jgi:hypothetical protein
VRQKNSSAGVPSKALAARSNGPDGATALLGGDAGIDAGSKGVVTVDEILSDPREWHGVACADPFEPDYGSGVGMARIHTDGTPDIRSSAHGGITCFLKASPDADFAGLDEEQGAPERVEAQQPAGDVQVDLFAAPQEPAAAPATMPAAGPPPAA